MRSLRLGKDSKPIMAQCQKQSRSPCGAGCIGPFLGGHLIGIRTPPRTLPQTSCSFQGGPVATIKQLPNLMEKVRTCSTYTPNCTAASQPNAIVSYLMSWTMIDCDLSSISICLSSLPPLLVKTAPFSIFDSIRSTFSLQSFSKWQSAIGRSDL